MLTIQRLQGRLVSIRAGSPLDVAELDLFRQAMVELPLLGQPPFVLCADVRRLRVLPAVLANELSVIMQHDNAFIA